MKRLQKKSFHVSVAVPERILEHFKKNDFASLIVLEELKQSSELKLDILFDLTYIGVPDLEPRMELLKRVSCPCITVSEIGRKLNVYDDFIDFSEVPHISERFSKIISYITKKYEKPVYPVTNVSEFLAIRLKEEIILKKRIAYLNTIARDKDRCFTLTQQQALLKHLINKGYFVIVNTEFSILTEPKTTYILPHIEFEELCGLVKNVDLIVTPDTAVTHIASAYNIPTFVVFPPNDRDYWQKFSASAVWGPLSRDNLVFFKDSENLEIDQYGYATKEPMSISVYYPSDLVCNLNVFINKLSKVKNVK